MAPTRGRLVCRLQDSEGHVLIDRRCHCTTPAPHDFLSSSYLVYSIFANFCNPQVTSLELRTSPNAATRLRRKLILVMIPQPFLPLPQVEGLELRTNLIGAEHCSLLFVLLSVSPKTHS